MTEQKSEKEVKEKAINLIPPTGKFFADGFNIIADKITRDLNEFAERQNDPEVKQLYITYRTMIVNWQDMARGFLNECLDLSELVENDFYAGLTLLAEYCERHAKEQTPKEGAKLQSKNQK